jgi:hypothetical protein
LYKFRLIILGPEISQIFARRISLDLVPRIPNSALYANKFLQTLSKCLFIHEDSSSNAILDSLKPLKAAILQQSLEKLTAIVYTILREETKSSIIVETVCLSFVK